MEENGVKWGKMKENGWNWGIVRNCQKSILGNVRKVCEIDRK